MLESAESARSNSRENSPESKDENFDREALLNILM